jgi:hypothetical protein
MPVFEGYRPPVLWLVMLPSLLIGAALILFEKLSPIERDM